MDQGLTCAVVVEEGIQAGPVDEDVGGAADAQTEGHAARCWGTSGAIGAEIGVVES